MARTKLFRSNRTQAVRLAKEVALPESVSEVDITVVGDARIIVPVRADWTDWWHNGARVTADYMVERDQPEVQEREW